MVSDAKKRANKKYHDKTYKNFTINARFKDYELIDTYCKNNDISRNKLLICAAKYCINNNVDLMEEINNYSGNNETAESQL